MPVQDLNEEVVVEWYVFRLYESLQKLSQCGIVTGGGRRLNPPLMPIPVERVFQIIGVDIMELPKTKQVNKYAAVF